MAEDFDAIVIGSGMGGLSVASILAQVFGKRVLILERHFKIGGFTRTFERPGGYHWDVGLHYVGGITEGSFPRRVFDFVTGGTLTWNPLPESFEKFVYPDLSFELRTGKDRWLADLSVAFPAERKALRRYVTDLFRVTTWSMASLAATPMPEFVKKLLGLIFFRGRRLDRLTTGQYLSKNFSDPRLRAVLASQWGDYGLPPSLSSFRVHATIALHYLDGAFYPIGGSSGIAAGAVKVVKDAGGDVRATHEVTGVILDGKRAVGVRAVRSAAGEKTEVEFRAPIVISDAGAYTTYARLIPESFPLPFRGELEKLVRPWSAVTLYVGFKDDPRKLGFKGENHWIYSGYDHDRLFEESRGITAGKATWCYLSFPSLKDPSAKVHTAEIITGAETTDFAKWSEQPWRRRGEDYSALKARISDALLDFVDVRYPGFRDLVAFHELSTPLTVESFTGHPSGMIYGVPATLERYKMDWLKVHTPVENLFLTGSDVVSHGIIGALMAGFITAGAIFGWRRGFGPITRAVNAYAESAAAPSSTAPKSPQSGQP